MLHILWLILKGILILLGILIGLLLLAVLLVLFCPIRYRGKVWKERNEGIRAAHVFGEVSWLFHGVSARVVLKNGKIEKEFYIFGISLPKLKKILRKKESSSEEKTTESITQTKESPKQPVVVKDDQELPEAEEITGTRISETEEKKETEETVETEKADSAPKMPEFEESPFSGAEIPPDEKKSNRISNLIIKIWEKIKTTAEKIRSGIRGVLAIPGKIIKKFQNLASTFRRFKTKVNWWKEFIDHPRTRAALSFLWKDAKKLLRHIFPTKIAGKVTFGSEDPSITGTVLAVLGMTIPFHKNKITVTPLFEDENILEGEVILRGRIYGVVLLKIAAELYFNKNIKYVIRRWRHKEVNHGERE